ncbi:DNA cytosine methyltransferase [Bacillus thuringiensis]|uniref:DNA cytosine methyltransferase n=1 Tax=Bacillus thuringiensis TaxID=1428 RepID=UPI000CF9F8B3|nr:DNA cytosine methyltransferase [Bacillus thuringiensis]PQQ45487.1 hypothetical protein C6A34_19330 [Bacillus thuringiensis]
MDFNNYKKPTVVSLLCGAGGMDYGFQQAGFEILLGIDIDKDSCETHRNWSGTKVANIDITKVEVDQIPDSDVIIGGFPVHSTCLVKNGFKDMNNSINLLNILFNIIGKKRPKAFLLESIPAQLTVNKGESFKDILNMFQDIGYDVTYEVMNSKNYGIAQNKIRLIMVGIRKDLCIKYEFPLKNECTYTVKEVLEDIVIENKEERKLIEREELNKHKKHYTIIDLDKVSPSLISSSNIFISNGNGVHVSILWEEAAVIQSFSKDIIFLGSRRSKMRQILNAFPPKLAFVLAERLRDALNNKEITEYSEKKSIVSNSSSMPFVHSNIVVNTQVSKNTKQLSLNLSEEKNTVNKNIRISSANSNAGATSRVPKSTKELCLTPSVKKMVVNENELIFKIEQITPGQEHANDYHNWVFESLKYIFDKELRRGRQEESINEGRKRIDIVFDNKEGEGFFWELNSLHHIRCAKILVECKNYTRDLKNPEFDQLIGRFHKNYSEFGILTCRSIKDEKQNLARCKDVINSGKGYVLTLCDADILALLKLRDEKRYEDISDYMRALYDKIFR